MLSRSGIVDSVDSPERTLPATKAARKESRREARCSVSWNPQPNASDVELRSISHGLVYYIVTDISYIMSDMSAHTLREARRRARLLQSELAVRAGTSQSAVARLERGIGSPTVATLERLVGAAGFDLRFELVPKAAPDPLVEAYKRDVDRTLLRENLSRTIDDRLRSLENAQAFGRELDRAMRTRAKKTKP